MRPMDIERRSMEIIESELQVELPDDVKPIVKRVIHATADFSFAENLYFAPGVVDRMRGMMQRGATLVTDTNMALAGINKTAAAHLGLALKCFMAEQDVAGEAKSRGVTRAEVSMERALAIQGPLILVCGNAPTFLFPLVNSARRDDVAAIGVPVGFVNVCEAKQQLVDSGVPCIAAMGRRGGSNVAAAIVNALMYGIEGARA
ncbi:MAG: precorrin-8X methylmutase [Candidatus Fimadaptatus sp.]|jgi:precorrin-8X/cobalt-precorrin-8 methylmutase